MIIANLSGFLLKFETENVRLLQEAGYEVHYASNADEKGYLYEPGQIEALGVAFHHIDMARSPYMLRMNTKALGQLTALMSREQFCLVHCHTPVGAVLGRLAASYCRSPKPVVLYTAHGFHFYRGAPLFNQVVYQMTERLLARLTDGMVLVNEEDYREAQTFRLRGNGPVWRIPGTGLDRERFRPASAGDRHRARECLGIPQEAFVLLSAGELNQNKNHAAAIRAVKYLTERHLPGPDIWYGICGDGFYREKLQQYIARLHMQDRVTLCGWQADMPLWYAAADMTVFPSRREGLGMAGLESLAVGVPVAAADNRGTREYMKDGQNGFVCRWNDVKGFAKGIQKYRVMLEQERLAMRACSIQSTEPFDRKYTDLVMRQVYREMEARWKNRWERY